MKPVPRKRGAPPPACEPAAYDEHDVTAVQALFAGVASPTQQKRALEWIIKEAAKTYDLHYRPGPDGDRETSFALGRAFVGQQIVKMTLLTVK